MYRAVWMIMIVLTGYLLGGCSPRNSYEWRLKRELASGIRNDSLFMGLTLGMTEKDFYSHCWRLNSEGLVKQGTQNNTVEYQVRKELKYPATMDFYPDFHNGRILEMPVRFIYNGWAPWNKTLSSDSLQADVLRWYQQAYGKGFFTVEHPDRGIAYTRIDGNRRITIFKENHMYVWAVFRDMSVDQDVDVAAAGENQK